MLLLLEDRGQKIQVAFNPRGGENFFNLLFDSRCLNIKLYRIIRPHKGKTNIDWTVIGATVRVLMLASVSVVDNTFLVRVRIYGLPRRKRVLALWDRSP
jgi:hypothetical protein